MTMKKGWILLCALLCLTGVSGGAAADDAAIPKEIQSPKERIEEGEQNLEEQKAVETERTIRERIAEDLKEHFGTLDIHGGAILYYQGSQVHQLNGENADSPDGPGFTADLELIWNLPWRCSKMERFTPASTPATAPAPTAGGSPTTRSMCSWPT
ncbi:MAG: hypothetical protein ACM3KE_05470 [Hyphomicrobiales bacterium]